jgi:L,D-transpeptidase YbiS
MARPQVPRQLKFARQPPIRMRTIGVMDRLPNQLFVNIARQTLEWRSGAGARAVFPVSTSRFGTGCGEDSFRTPLGRFRICEKIGAGCPPGTRFVARQPVGVWRPDDQDPDPGDDLILTRILRLDGLDPDNANTFQRFIYIHGTNQESLLGQPASHGCVRMANADILRLFERVETGDLVVIEAGCEAGAALAPGPRLC